jgi:hypothetical protein
VTPETVRLKDLYEALSFVESSLAATARELGAGEDDDLTVSLTGVSEGSNTLSLSTSPIMFQAAGVVTSSLASNDYAKVPPAARVGLRKLWQKANKQSWEFRFLPDGNGITAASVSKRREILKPGAVSGLTTIYGKCIDAGGARKLTVRIQLATGDFFTATVANLELARGLGARLHEWVGLEGEAKWNLETWSLEDFKVTRITEYRETDVVTAFELLATAAGDAWDGVDAEEYVGDLRAD